MERSFRLSALVGIELGVAQEVAERGNEKKSAITRLTGRYIRLFFIFLLCPNHAFRHRNVAFRSVLGA